MLKSWINGKLWVENLITATSCQTNILLITKITSFLYIIRYINKAETTTLNAREYEPCPLIIKKPTEVDLQDQNWCTFQLEEWDITDTEV